MSLEIVRLLSDGATKGFLRAHRNHAEKGHNCGEWTHIS